MYLVVIILYDRPTPTFIRFSKPPYQNTMNGFDASPCKTTIYAFNYNFNFNFLSNEIEEKEKRK